MGTFHYRIPVLLIFHEQKLTGIKLLHRAHPNASRQGQSRSGQLPSDCSIHLSTRANSSTAASSSNSIVSSILPIDRCPTSANATGATTPPAAVTNPGISGTCTFCPLPLPAAPPAFILILAPPMATPLGSIFTKLPPAFRVISAPASMTAFWPALMCSSVPELLSQAVPALRCRVPVTLKLWSLPVCSRFSPSTVWWLLHLVWLKRLFSTVRWLSFLVTSVRLFSVSRSRSFWACT